MIVANEVKALASQTKEATLGINNILTSVNQQTKEVENSIYDGKSMLETTKHSANQVKESILGIQALAKETNALSENNEKMANFINSSTEEVNESMNTLSDMSENTVSGMEKVYHTVFELDEALKQIENSFDELEKRMKEALS